MYCIIGWAMSQSRMTGCWTSLGCGVGRSGRKRAEIKRIRLGGRFGLDAIVDHQVVTAPLDVADDRLVLGLLGCHDRDVGVLGGGRGLERVGQVSVAVRDGQHLGLARRADDRVGPVVQLECVLDRQAHLVGGQAVVGQVELERLVALGASLSAIASTSVPSSPGLSAAWRIELGFGGDLFGAVVVHAAEELVDLGLVFVAPGLECQDRDVVRRVSRPDFAVGRRARSVGRRRIRWGRRARSRRPRARGCPG